MYSDNRLSENGEPAAGEAIIPAACGNVLN
jgi:hypothetical protein